jgi:hypothetical protein
MPAPAGPPRIRLPDFPLTSPGICGARFLRQQEAGATFFGGAQGSPPAVPKTRLMAAEPLSPELVLVSPDLRERARSSLPTIDPDALFVVAPRPAPVVEEPEGRRSVALAAYTVEALLWGTLRGVAMFAVIAAAAFLLAR